MTTQCLGKTDHQTHSRHRGALTFVTLRRFPPSSPSKHLLCTHQRRLVPAPIHTKTRLRDKTLRLEGQGADVARSCERCAERVVVIQSFPTARNTDQRVYTLPRPPYEKLLTSSSIRRSRSSSASSISPGIVSIVVVSLITASSPVISSVCNKKQLSQA